MRKPIIYGIVVVFFMATLFSSCSRKGYYPRRKLPKKDCGCGSFGAVDNQITTYEWEGFQKRATTIFTG
jgi:hypothetical protein